MAIADFGGLVLGQRIKLLTADHQNKPDIGAQKFREWADRDGLTMVMLGANTGVSLAMAVIAKEKKIPFFAIGATGASSRARIAPHIRSTTSMTRRRSGSAPRRRSSTRAGRPGFFYLRLRLRHTAARRRRARRHRQWREGNRRCGVPLAASDFASYLCRRRAPGRRSSRLRTPAATSPTR